MKSNLLRIIFLILLVFAFASPAMAGDPVPLPCDPVDCPPIDPCKLAPERCKDKGGPITKTTAGEVEKSDDPCKWCEPCSRTPGSECLSCCAK